MPYTLHTCGTTEEWTSLAVSALVRRIERSIAKHGSCIIGLSGGSTPLPVYERLRTEPIPWEKIRFFLVDERYVSVDDPQSNQRMITEIFGETGARIIAPDTSRPLAQCVRDYGEKLETLWADHRPDIMVLGMGEDGHTASLFPPLPEAVIRSTDLVLHTLAPPPFTVSDRITLSPHALLQARSSLILFRGEKKREIFQEMEKQNDQSWPLHGVMKQINVTVIVTL